MTRLRRNLSAANRLIIVASASWSVSTLIYNALKNASIGARIFHEDIAIQVSRPRIYNHAYDDALRDLRYRIEFWAKKQALGDAARQLGLRSGAKCREFQ